MRHPAIPTPAQIRAMPVTSVKALREALTAAGLRVRPGGAHLRVETADGRFLVSMPHTPSDHRNLLNTRSDLARRVAQIRAARRNTNHHQEKP